MEPDRDMRKKAEDNLFHYLHFHSINACAENTGLCQHSVSLITAASAFHWFNITEFKRECVRILDGNGLVCIIYNVRM